MPCGDEAAEQVVLAAGRSQLEQPERGIFLAEFLVTARQEEPRGGVPLLF
jgi:hypothetical protein